MIDAAQYPQLAHMQEVQDESQAIGEFLAWLSEQQLTICKIGVPAGMVNEYYVPHNRSSEQVLADYFGVDLAAVERERRAVLEAHRHTGGENASSTGSPA